MSIGPVVRNIILLILLFVPSVLSAQISAPGSNAVRLTSYTSGGVNHPVFIYCASGAPSPELTAISPGGTGPFDFEWSAWDTFSADFSTPLGTESSVFTSQQNGLTEGGYRVRITDAGGYDTSLIAWIHIDQPVSIALLQNRTCYYVALDGTAETDSYNYYDIVTGQAIELPNDIYFDWWSDPTSSIPDDPSLEIDPITYAPPLEDVTYYLTVSDSFGCIAESSFFYESIHVKADFEIEPVSGEAPLEITITDNSIRASKYTWDFGNDTISNDPSPVSYTYYIPGIYYIRLSIESDRLCVDSLTSAQIIVEPSSLEIPNVFTPDGDGNNEFFYVESKSLKSIDVQVFSRSGKRVYYFNGEGDSLREWQGWDGKIGSSRATAGIYYYIIRARGWDSVIYDSEEYRGFVYLYR